MLTDLSSSAKTGQIKAISNCFWFDDSAVFLLIYTKHEQNFCNSRFSAKGFFCKIAVFASANSPLQISCWFCSLCEISLRTLVLLKKLTSLVQLMLVLYGYRPARKLTSDHYKATLLCWNIYFLLKKPRPFGRMSFGINPQ